MITRLVLAAAVVVAASYALLAHFYNRGKGKGRSAVWFKGSARLPKFALPISYDIQLRPDLQTWIFEGKIVVALNIVKETSHLVLNAFDLDISQDSVSLRMKDSNQVLLPVYVELDKVDEILMLSFEQSLPLTEVILSMEFKGTLNDH
eukprot:c19007_g1_i1 orf=1-441(-)